MFSNELYENPKKYAPGSIVELYDMKDAFIGIGYINPQSLISVRILTRDREPVDKEFFSKRIKDALMLREKLLGARDAMRLIYSEGDFLPGLIAGKYKNCLVLQFLTAGMEAMKETIINLFKDSGRRIRLLSLRSQSPDHPILLSMPETEYLKCAFLLVE